MNILQLVPELNIGGAEKSAVEVASYLALNGHRSVVVSGGGILERNLLASGVKHYTVPVGRKNPFVMVYCYFRLKAIIRKEDIEIVHARSRIPALTGYFAARRTHRIFITTAHGQYNTHFISRVMGWGKLVITANETMARFMKDNFNVPSNKIVIVPRGVDLEKFVYISPKERKGKTIRIGMIARFTELKGHLDFLKAASYVSRSVNNIEIILMGDRDHAKPEYMRKLELEIRRLMLSNIVKFVDMGNDVAQVLKDLDVFVSANRAQEAFGRSVIEAQARGVPVVSTRVGGVIENVVDGLTGLVCEPQDPRGMADRILRYIREPELRERISANARENVSKKYPLDRTMRMTLDAYYRVLGMKSILIFKISSLGDVILSTPSIRAIAKKFKGANTTLAIDTRFRDVVKNCPYVNELIFCDFKEKDRYLGFLKLAETLRSRDFDISIDLQNTNRTHLLSFLAGVPERYGYDNGKLSFLLNHKINLPEEATSPVAHQARVLGLAGITNVEHQLELWPDEDSIVWARDFLENAWIKKDQRIVALSLAASKRWPTKNWLFSSMVELAELLAEKESIRVIILGTEDERSIAQEFIKKTKAKPIDAVGKTNISRLIALIKCSDCLVTGDSAPLHIASAVGTPFVAIFGPTDPRRHLNPSKRYSLLYKKLRCAPCYSTTCSKNMKCMKSISPKEVFNAVMQLISKEAGR